LHCLLLWPVPLLHCMIVTCQFPSSILLLQLKVRYHYGAACRASRPACILPAVVVSHYFSCATGLRDDKQPETTGPEHIHQFECDVLFGFTTLNCDPPLARTALLHRVPRTSLRSCVPAGHQWARSSCDDGWLSDLRLPNGTTEGESDTLQSHTSNSNQKHCPAVIQ
jgi:hypothetical protein